MEAGSDSAICRQEDGTDGNAVGAGNHKHRPQKRENKKYEETQRRWDPSGKEEERQIGEGESKGFMYTRRERSGKWKAKRGRE